ncbi:uncharacterized protein N7479_007294 [Penicillium vulpinum]|uniref:uncharacterized protein n=1 Tax=Penicillium vulpinum TaxID=29845 RepID=UPI0025488B79|nr:uncharacterized protein N7479_007294 [Penicillium vulpinum]KAJ5960144.1 hypothetical protein N7479_007294 [Penicillium vulpinum]
MDFDNIAVQQSHRLFQVWLQNLLRNSPEELAASRLTNGAFNICYRVTFVNGYRVVRFVAPGRVLARKEKVEDEVAVMQYISQ